MALLASSRGYKCILTMPENISNDKVEAMKMFGAKVLLQPCVPYSNPEHFLRTAERLSKEISN